MFNFLKFYRQFSMLLLEKKIIVLENLVTVNNFLGDYNKNK